jgi:hypothetical protein
MPEDFPAITFDASPSASVTAVFPRFHHVTFKLDRARHASLLRALDLDHLAAQLPCLSAGEANFPVPQDELELFKQLQARLLILFFFFEIALGVTAKYGWAKADAAPHRRGGRGWKAVGTSCATKPQIVVSPFEGSRRRSRPVRSC